MNNIFDPTHPGRILQDFMDNREWGIEKVVEESGLDVDVVKQLLSESADITEEMSSKLSKAFDMGEGFFMRLQDTYEVNISQSNELEDVSDYAKDIPKIGVHDSILCALSAGGPSVIYNTVHLQKLMFLMDKKVTGVFGGPFFVFKPHKYGPFDSSVYEPINQLVRDEFIESIPHHQRGKRKYQRFTLESKGYKKGMIILDRMPKNIRISITDISEYVSSREYQSLIDAIYKDYPEMKENCRASKCSWRI